MARVAGAQELPELTQPVNDFAAIVDPASRQALDSLIRSLERASGDVVVVATVDTIAPYATVDEYAVKLFENHGKGIGQRGKDNGLLVLVAVKERTVKVEVGYDLEEFVTDGFAGETSRDYMAPEFRRGNYGTGLLAGVSRIIARIAERRNVTLQGVPTQQRRQEPTDIGGGGSIIFAIFILFMVINAIAGRLGRRRRRRYWGGGPWSGWNSGVGPFGGGGFGGGFGGGGGGFGGGFGGFGGGRSGGGGGGASW